MKDHPDLDQLVAFALDALPVEDAAAVTTHLARCADCRRDVAEWREVTSAVAALAPTAPPPIGMRERVLARATAPHLRVSAAENPPAGLRRGGRLAVAAGLVLMVGLGSALATLYADHARLASRVAEVTAIADAQAQTLATQDSLLARVLGPETSIATLAATGANPSLRLYWDRGRGEMVVSARRLAPAAPGRTYQLWGIGADGQPVGLGTFNTAATGSAVLVLAVDGTRRFDVSAVTVEPDGGSPSPTTSPILVGRWPAEPIQSRD